MNNTCQGVSQETTAITSSEKLRCFERLKKRLLRRGEKREGRTLLGFEQGRPD